MLSRFASPRARLALAVAVFVAGAGIGVGIVLATRDGSRPRSVAGAPEPGSPATVTVTRPRPPATHPAGHPAGALLDASAQSSFAALERGLGGSSGVAIQSLGPGSIVSLGEAQVARAWSTSKVPVLVTLLGDAERGRTSIDQQDRANAAAALEQSDNTAIEALFSRLERIHGGLMTASAAVQQVLRRAGDTTTAINTEPNDQGFTTYGQTEWSLTGEVRFYRALADGCLLDGRDTAYVLGLMRSVVASQRWGAGSAGYGSGVSVAFKGGWGPENGRYQVRQTAIISSGDHGYVVSLLALPASGAFSDGTSMLTRLATWARQHVDLGAAGAASGCQH